MRTDWLWLGQVTMAALVNVSFAFAVGSTFFAAWLRADARNQAAPARAAWLRAQRSLRAAAFVLVVALAMWLLYESAAISGSALPAAFGVVPAVLAQTHVGAAWIVAFTGSVVLLVAAFVDGGPLRDGVSWLAIVVVSAGHAALGHAADAGLVSAALGLHTLHVLSASVWSGIVIAGGLSVMPALGTSTARGVLIRTAGQVSSLALFAVGFVLATGLFNGVRGTGGSLAALAHSAWGHVLLLKLVLVLFAVVLGGLNRISTLPRLKRTASTADARDFANLLYLEGLLMIGVLVVAAALAHSVPGYVMIG
ncbi:putative copper resistance protein D [Paraburkholderia caballeronis]|uniref:CopD family protein n=1 Tax=Paraburkholderia caballeronis TaxID=416943 RepID=UPI001066B5AE|nr:CopD family protein [Paraburkholderia caballeronis]TDV35126.1 putative copper resistance protein D [Paraburkholderia caballeronis]